MSMEKSPARRRREALSKRRQEAKWARKSGPVVTYRVGDVRPDEDDSARDDRSVEGKPE